MTRAGRVRRAVGACLLLAALAALAALVGLPACSGGDGRVLSIGLEGGGAPPAEARVGDTLRFVATLQGAGAEAAARTVVSNAPALAWRATPRGIGVFSPSGGPTDPVVLTFHKEGTATVWATFERLESAEIEIVVRPAAP